MRWMTRRLRTARSPRTAAGSVLCTHGCAGPRVPARNANINLSPIEAQTRAEKRSATTHDTHTCARLHLFLSVIAAAQQQLQRWWLECRNQVRRNPVTRVASGLMGQRPECPSAHQSFTRRRPQGRALTHRWAAQQQRSGCLSWPQRSSYVWQGGQSNA